MMVSLTDVVDVPTQLGIHFSRLSCISPCSDTAADESLGQSLADELSLLEQEGAAQSAVTPQPVEEATPGSSEDAKARIVLSVPVSLSTEMREKPEEGQSAKAYEAMILTLESELEELQEQLQVCD